MKVSPILVVLLTVVCQVVGAAPEEGAANRLVESPLSAANLAETGFGLIAVLAIMLGLAWVVKRFIQVPGMARGRVQVLGGVSLGARERAVLLSVEGQRILVGVAPGQVRKLMLLGDADEPDTVFEEQLATAQRKRDTTEELA